MSKKDKERISDENLIELYKRTISGDGDGDWDNPSWRKSCLEAIRGCLEADSLDLAVSVLELNGWSFPVEGAMALRGKEKEVVLKLFVWEGVLRDWTGGMICVLAPDVVTAIKLVRNKYSDYYATECSADTAKVVTSPEAFAVHGGG